MFSIGDKQQFKGQCLFGQEFVMKKGVTNTAACSKAQPFLTSKNIQPKAAASLLQMSNAA